MSDLSLAYAVKRRSKVPANEKLSPMSEPGGDMTPPQGDMDMEDRHEEFRASPNYKEAYESFCNGGMASGGIVDMSASEEDPMDFDALLADDHDDEGEKMSKGGMLGSILMKKRKAL